MPCGSNPNYKKMNRQTNPKAQPDSSGIIRKVIGKNPVHLKKGRAL